MPSRRELLRAGGLALTAGLAGCYTGAFPGSTVHVSLREDFSSDAPVEVPVDVGIELQNVDDKRVAMRDVHVALYDSERRPIGRERLGDFSWKGAPESQRESKEEEDAFGSQTIYYAEFSESATVSTDRVPEWVTVHLGDLSFDGESVVDAAGNTQPPPKLTATIQRYQGLRSAAPTVSPQVYDPVEVEKYDGVHGSGVVLPPGDIETPTKTASPTGTVPPNGTDTDATTASPNGTQTDDPSDQD